MILKNQSISEFDQNWGRPLLHLSKYVFLYSPLFKFSCIDPLLKFITIPSCSDSKYPYWDMIVVWFFFALSNITGSGFDIDVKNGSSFVNRNFKYAATGFGRGS